MGEGEVYKEWRGALKWPHHPRRSKRELASGSGTEVAVQYQFLKVDESEMYGSGHYVVMNNFRGIRI